MAARRRRRAGRPRRNRLLAEGGNPTPERKDSGSPYLLRHRAERVGRENQHDPKAEHALGVLALSGVVDEAQYAAGCAFERLSISFRCMAEAKRPHASIARYDRSDRTTGGSIMAFRPEDWCRVKESYEAALGLLRGRPDAATRRELIGVILYNRVPGWHWRLRRGRGRLGDLRRQEAFLEGMEALTYFFGTRGLKAS